MAGLYDGIDPQTALLLGLGSGLLGTTGNGRRASFAEALAAGSQQGQQGYRQAISDRQRAQQIAAEQAAREQQMMLARAQMQLAQQNAERESQMFPGQLQAQRLGLERTQSELDAQRAAQQQAVQMRAVLGSLAGGGGGGSVMAGPTLEGPADPVSMPGGGGSSSPEDYKAQIIRLVQSGQLPPAQGKALIESADYGRAEVKRSVDAQLKDGRPATQQLDIYGRPVGDLIPKAYERRFQDFGGTVNGIDPYTGQPMGAAMPKSMTPGEVASNKIAQGQLGVSQANLGLSRQRLAFDQGQSGGLVYNAEAGGFIPKNIRPGDTPTVVPLPGGGLGKPPNDSQGKALLFGSRMKQADAQIAQLEAGGTKSGNRVQQGLESIPGIGRALGMAANPLVSDNQQSYAQARRNFINAALRRESGAVISPSEEANADLQYFPQPGDGPRVLEQKRQNRKLAMDAVLYEAGPHAAQADKMIPPASQNFVGGQSASGQIKPAGAQTGVMRFDANGNLIGN